MSVGKYGNQKMNQSHTKPDFRLIENFSILTEKLDGQLVWVRARLHTSRAKGKDKYANSQSMYFSKVFSTSTFLDYSAFHLFSKCHTVIAKHL